MLKTLVVPLDGSLLAETAIPHALALARPTKAMIHIVRVVTPRMGGQLDQFQTDRQHTAQAEQYLSPIQAQMREEGARVRTTVLHGYPIDQLLIHSAQVQADLIVMATHGRSGVQRLILGSVADRIVREAACPVVLVRGEMPVRTCLRILVPLDGTTLGEAVLPIAATLARTLHARLTLLRAVPRATYNLHRLAVHQAEHYLEELAEPFRHSGLVVETCSDIGDPRQVITRYAQECQPDLIVMTTHTCLPIERGFFGSVADHVLHHVNVPLVMYHYQDDPVCRDEPQQQAHLAARA